MAVISVSLPDSLLDRTDELIEDRGYAGRSELVRNALREFINRASQDQATGHRDATLTVIYPHGVERKVSNVRHEFSEIVQAMMHGHTGEACVEVFLLSGQAKEVRAFLDGLRSIREVYLVEATYTDLPVHG